jgi:hypothetical protein
MTFAELLFCLLLWYGLVNYADAADSQGFSDLTVVYRGSVFIADFRSVSFGGLDLYDSPTASTHSITRTIAALVRIRQPLKYVVVGRPASHVRAWCPFLLFQLWLHACSWCVPECRDLAASYCLGFVDPYPTPRSGGWYRRLRHLLGEGVDDDAHKSRPFPLDQELLSSPNLVPLVCLHNASAAQAAQRPGLAQVKCWLPDAFRVVPLPSCVVFPP